LKYYTIIGGVHGAGKSSLTGVLKAQLRDLGLIIDVDRFAAYAGGNLAGGKMAILAINDCLAKGLSCTQETTLSGVYIARTAAKARTLGYAVRLYYVGLDSLDEHLRRIRNRVRKGGHDIPADAVARRFNERISALRRILPYCDEAEFFDNENGFSQVAEYRNGEIITFSPEPKWLKDLTT
jgi:predicted ABC-type ATPase